MSHTISDMLGLVARATVTSAMCERLPKTPGCERVRSYYLYHLNLAANATFLALFSLSCLLFLLTCAATRRGYAFTTALVLGTLCEVLGYAGRVMSWQNPWKEEGFLMQIVCLTIGPAFMAAGIYLCLRRIVAAFGAANSRIPPAYYTRIFIPCDVVSLVLQAAGGGIASVASHRGTPTRTGDDIMIAGLSFQVLTLLVFIAIAADFALRAWRRHRRLGEAAFDQSEAVRRLRRSRAFRGFLGALALSTVCIFWRCVYRVAELSRGWDGPLMRRQGLFIGFEGVMIAVACLVLNIFHPNFCFKELISSRGRGRGSKGKEVGEEQEEVEKGGAETPGFEESVSREGRQ